MKSMSWSLLGIQYGKYGEKLFEGEFREGKFWDGKGKIKSKI